MVVSSYLVLQWIHLALLVRVGGMFFREDFISGSVNLKLGAPRFSGYLQNRRCLRQAQLGSCRVATALTTPDFLAAGPVSMLQGSNCNLTTPVFWQQAQQEGCRIATAI